MALVQILGSNVKRLRLELGLSQEEFAHRAELHPTYVSGIEGGRRNPTIQVVERIAKALNVEPARLLEVTQN